MQIKRFKTTIEWDWDVRGEVTPEMISEVTRGFLGVIMMTGGDAEFESNNYAFRGRENAIDVVTEEVVENVEEEEKN